MRPQELNSVKNVVECFDLNVNCFEYMPHDKI